MGPLMLMRYAANALEWAYWCCWKILQMVVDRPAVSCKKSCWWSQMYLFLLPQTVAIPLDRPIVAVEKGLLILTNVPTVSPERCCWYPCHGPIHNHQQHFLVATVSLYKTIGSIAWEKQWGSPMAIGSIFGSNNGPMLGHWQQLLGDTAGPFVIMSSITWQQ